MRLMSAIILSLPGVFLCVWYSSSAVLKLLSYQTALGEKVAMDFELFQVYLHDILQRDVNWIVYSDEPEKSTIDLFNLNISKGDLITMYSQADKDDDRLYVPARLCLNYQVQCRDVEVRLRGSRHWHLLSRKKSLKIRVTDGKPFHGHEVFNLVNQVSPMVVGQKVISDVADENGVMVPTYSFVRLLLNGEDLGVLHFQAQPDDSLFRRKAIMFSDFYSGDLNKKADPMALWNDVALWNKVTSRLHSNKHDVQRLKEFLHHITQSSYHDFARYARQHVNFEAFAAFEAIDVVCGIEQHGFRENQKLYFDPYIGSWVPVAWDLAGFKHSGVINRVENPITIRLKMIPEYRAMRNKAVWELLNGDANTNRIRKRARKQLEKIIPELTNDRLFSAYKLLPKVNEFAFKMLRPMDMDKLNLVLESEMLSYERRHAFLLNQLQKNEFYYQRGATMEVAPTPVEPVSAEPSDSDVTESGELSAGDTAASDASVDVANGETAEEDAPKPEAGVLYRTPLDIIVAGETGVTLRDISVAFDTDCWHPVWKILMGNTVVATADKSTSATFTFDETLYAAVALTERMKGDADLTRIEVATVPTSYPLMMESSCKPGNVDIFATHEITQNRIRAQKPDAEVLAMLPKTFPSEQDVPQFSVGVLSPHPQTMTTPEIKQIQLGPGIVKVVKTRVFNEYTHVTIAPGTTFEMGNNVSMLFKGQVMMNGVAGNPIVFKQSGEKPWGGVALQGRNTAGSIISNVQLEDGSNIVGQPVVYTSMLNLHNSENIIVQGCKIRNNHGLWDAFHGAYVKNLKIADLTVENVTMDAVDIEFCTADITRLFVRKTGDDGLDLMDSEVRFSDSVIIGCKQHGISAGENSWLKATDFLVARNVNGVFGKDASKIEIGTGLLMRNETGVRVGKPTGLYSGDVEVAASSLYILGAKKLVTRADRKKNRLDDGKILFGFVDDRPLRHFFSDVIDISGPEALDEWLSEREVH